MNERIKELWEESTLSIWPSPGKFTAGEYDYNLKAFADALLREYIAPLQEELDRAHNIIVHNERDWGVREVQITLLTNLIQDTKAKFELEDEIEYCPTCGEEWSGTSCGALRCGWIVGNEE